MNKSLLIQKGYFLKFLMCHFAKIHARCHHWIVHKGSIVQHLRNSKEYLNIFYKVMAKTQG